MNEVKNIEAFEYLTEQQDEAFDLIILDPNYQDWNDFLDRDILGMAMRVLKKTGNILCFTKQPFDYDLRIACNPYFRREFVWTFENGGAWISPNMPLVSTQKVFWLVKSDDFFFNPRTGIAYSANTSDFKRSTKVFEGYCEEGKQFTKSDEGIWIRDHLHFNKPNCGDIPQKPRELIEIFIKCFCPKDGCVLDPFSGSGIIPVVCANMGIDFKACELNPDRYDFIMQNLRSFGMDDREKKAEDGQMDIWCYI